MVPQGGRSRPRLLRVVVYQGVCVFDALGDSLAAGTKSVALLFQRLIEEGLARVWKAPSDFDGDVREYCIGVHKCGAWLRTLLVKAFELVAVAHLEEKPDQDMGNRACLMFLEDLDHTLSLGQGSWPQGAGAIEDTCETTMDLICLMKGVVRPAQTTP